MKGFLIFDVDRPGAAFASEDGNLPPPTFAVINPCNTYAHLIYALKDPVCFFVAGRSAPQKYYDAVMWVYRERLGGDMGYAGLVAKNPWHEAWLKKEDGNAVYDLADLAKFVTLPSKPPKQENALGRNCTLFDTLRVWTYRAIRDYWRPDGEAAWHEAVRLEAQRLNDFPEALPSNEVKHIVRSVARWTWRHTTPERLKELIRATHTPELQRARRAKLAEKQDAVKAQGLKMIKDGASGSEVAVKLKVSERTVRNWRRTL
jgi:hypothetical protein